MVPCFVPSTMTFANDTGSLPFSSARPEIRPVTAAGGAPAAGRVWASADPATPTSESVATNVTSKRLEEANMGGSPPEEATGRTVEPGRLLNTLENPCQSLNVRGRCQRHSRTQLVRETRVPESCVGERRVDRGGPTWEPMEPGAAGRLGQRTRNYAEMHPLAGCRPGVRYARQR